MKKTLIILAIIITILSINKEEKVIIPKEAIRFRVIANSDKDEDQELKRKVVGNLSTEIKKTSNLQTLEETRKFITKELPTFENIVEKTLEESNVEKVFHINYGKNYFPKKEYKDVIYEDGEYESLVITLGEGEGENFWCVLFPPLCFIEKEKEQYKSFIKEMIDKYF